MVYTYIETQLCHHRCLFGKIIGNTSPSLKTGERCSPFPRPHATTFMVVLLTQSYRSYTIIIVKTAPICHE